MHIHILGVCGTFMGSLAVLAKQLGHQVSGSDQNVYPPMSTQLEAQGIILNEGYESSHLQPRPDMVVIGNTCSRGNAAVEYVLNEGLPYTSGPQWLAEHVLQDRWVLAAAGTHGKTTTASMLAWILRCADMNPGYLIGGVPKNFSCSADLGESPFFVIEADEYDSAFFDKRSKFIHYRPRTAILGNLEFDHADIFDDLEAIQQQFHHLVKTIPKNGLLVAPQGDDNIQAVFDKGLWSERQTFGVDSAEQSDWQAKILDASGQHFSISGLNKVCEVHWSLTGRHNVQNALGAVIAAAHAGVPLEISTKALNDFDGVKRRLELIGDIAGVQVYDDFAHHPTAIQTTLEGVRAKMQDEGQKGRLIAVIEARSNTMKMGYHQETLPGALAAADQIFWYSNAQTQLDLRKIAEASSNEFITLESVTEIVESLSRQARSGDRIIIMSNGGFENLHKRLCEALTIRDR